MLYDNVRNNLKDLRDHFSSLKGRKIILVIIVAIIGLLIFHAGVVVGSHRHFRGAGGRGYGFHPVPGLSSEVRMPQGFIEGGHGTVGVVESAAGDTLTVRMRDGSEQTVLLNGKTVIRTMNGDASSSAISAGDEIIVLGAPNDTDDTISADLIRIIQNVSQPLR